MAIRLTWTEPNFGESSVKVYRDTSTMDPMSLPSPLATLDPDSVSYVDTTAVDSTTYYYRVSSTVNGTEYVSDEVSILADEPTVADLWTTPATDGIWLDPSDLTTMFTDDGATTNVTTDGDTVAVMHDKSGNGNHATQTISGARPIYRTDGSFHWLEFDGDRYFDFANNSWGDNVTIGCGEQSDADGQGGMIFDCATNTTFASSHGIRFDRFVNRFRMGVSAGGSGSFAIENISSTDKMVLRARYNGTTNEIWRNGVSVDTDTNESGAITYTGCDTKLGTVFSAATGGGYFYEGKIFVFLLVSRACDSSEMDLIDSYIDQKTDGALVA